MVDMSCKREVPRAEHIRSNVQRGIRQTLTDNTCLRLQPQPEVTG